VVEWVGLVAGDFQFFTRLAAVFAEEVSGFGPRREKFHFVLYRLRMGSS